MILYHVMLISWEFSQILAFSVCLFYYKMKTYGSVSNGFLAISSSAVKRWNCMYNTDNLIVFYLRLEGTSEVNRWQQIYFREKK